MIIAKTGEHHPLDDLAVKIAKEINAKIVTIIVRTEDGKTERGQTGIALVTSETKHVLDVPGMLTDMSIEISDMIERGELETGEGEKE